MYVEAELLLNASVDELIARNDVAFRWSHVFREKGSAWLLVDGYKVPDGMEPEPATRSPLSAALSCRVIELMGCGEGFCATVFDSGEVTRMVSNMSRKWVVRGTEVQDWEQKLVEDGIPEYAFKPIREQYDDSELEAYENALGLYEAELAACETEQDKCVIVNRALVPGATLPWTSWDLEKFELVGRTRKHGERIKVREIAEAAPPPKRGLFARLFGK